MKRIIISPETFEKMKALKQKLNIKKNTSLVEYLIDKLVKEYNL